MGTQQFCLKWNNHSSNMLDAFGQMLSSEAMVDVTLACAGASLKAHKLVLSACSPFFQNMFLENPCKHPIVILHDLSYADLRALIEFMYNGEVNVSQNQLTTLLKLAETLKVKGLGEFLNEQKQQSSLTMVQDLSAQESMSSEASFPADNSSTLPSEKTDILNEHEGETHDQSHSSLDINKQVQLPLETDLCEDMDSEPCDVKPKICKEHNVKTESQSAVSSDKNDNIGLLIANIESTSESVSCEEEQYEVEPCCLMEQSMTTEKVFSKELIPQQKSHTITFTKKNDVSSPDLDNDKSINILTKALQDSNCSPHQDIQVIKANCNDWNDSFSTSPSTSLSQETGTSVMNKQTSFTSVPLLSCLRAMPSFSAEKLQVGMLSITELEDPTNIPKRGRKPGSRLCVLCKHIFNCESDLQQHMQNHRDGTISNIVEPTTIPQTLATPDPQSVTEDNLVMFPQPCSVCNYVLNTMSDAQSHLTMNPICRTSQFKCPLCPKIFIWPATLTKHFREQHLGPEGTARVTQRLWFFCDICKKPLLSKHALSLHKSKFHGSHPSSHFFDQKADSPNSCKRGRKQGTRVCRQCKRTFTSTTDFHLHLQNSHKDETSFQCTQELALATGDESSFSGMSSVENESNSAQSTVKGD